MGRRSTIGLGKGFSVEHDRRYSPESGNFEYNFLLTIDKGFFKEVEHCEDYIEIELDENSEFAQLLVKALTEDMLTHQSESNIKDFTEDGNTIKKL